MQKAPGCRIAVGRFIFGFQLERVHINRNTQIAKQIFCRARQFFAGVLYVRQEKLTQLCGKFAAR
mgnify:CR=1 FL=1